MSAYTDRMNAINRMSEADRNQEILRSAFGPLYPQMFTTDLHKPQAERAPDSPPLPNGSATA